MFSDDKDGNQVMAIPHTTIWVRYQHSNSLLKSLICIFIFIEIPMCIDLTISQLSESNAANIQNFEFLFKPSFDQSFFR